MILYHFTKPELVAAIQAQGLRPAVDDSGMTRRRAVVWLTEETEAPWLIDCPVRLAVRIGSHDRRLVRYVPWLNGQPVWPGKPINCEEFPAMARWWIYLGDIPAVRLLQAA